MKIIWTRESCKKESQKYNSRNEFKKHNESAYRASLKNGWIDYVCSHMNKNITKPKGYWNKDKCIEMVLKCKTRCEFQKKYLSAYTASIRNNWLDEICSHMNKIKPSNYWSKEKCHQEALKFNSKTEFQKNSSSAYQKSIRKGWINEICKHMKPKNSIISRYIYAFEFVDNSVYVGLTFDVIKRKNEHLKNEKSKVFKHIKICDKYNFLVLTNKSHIESEASKLEREFISNYKNNGWTILNNMSQVGNLGSRKLYWTKERCQNEALKYKSKGDFRKYSNSAYQSSFRNKWLNEVCKHMN